MKRSTKVLRLGIIFAVLLSSVITAIGYSVLQDASLRSRQVNRTVVSDEPYLQRVYTNGTFAHSSNTSPGCNVTAATIIPSYVVVNAGDFSLSILFTVMVAANVSFASGGDAGWDPGEGWVSAGFLNYGGWGWQGSTDYPSYPTLRVNGTGLGGTGVGVWNVTLQMHFYGTPPPLFLLNQSDWLLFTTQADNNIMFVEFDGYVHTVNGNGTENTYFASAVFTLEESPITFITFGYPIAALLGYGASVLVAVASLYLLHRLRVKTGHKAEESHIIWWKWLC